MPYGMGMGSYGMFSGGGGGAVGGAGKGLAEGLEAAMKYRLEKEQADKMAQQVAWMQNPANPENALKGQEARAYGNTKNQTIDAGTLFGKQFAGRQIPIDQALPYLFSKFGMMPSGPIAPTAGGGGGNGAGGGSAAFIDPKDQQLVEDLSTELGSIKGAYDTASQKKLFGSSLGNRVSQGLTKLGAQNIPFIGSDVAELEEPGAQDYTTRMQDAMFRVAKILSGGRPNEKMQTELQNQIPQIGLDPVKADAQFNALMSSAASRAQGLVNNYRVRGMDAQAQALSNQLNGLFGQFKIGSPGGGISSNIPGEGIKPMANGTGTISESGNTDLSQPAPSDQFAKQRMLAQTIMGDQNASDSDRAWASKYMPAAPLTPANPAQPGGVPALPMLPPTPGM